MATMMDPRARWTDDRLDDLNKKVDDGFARVEKQIGDEVGRLEKKIGDEVGRVEKKMDVGFARVDNDIRELRTDIQNLNRTLFIGAIGIIAALLGCASTFAGIAIF